MSRSGRPKKVDSLAGFRSRRGPAGEEEEAAEEAAEVPAGLLKEARRSGQLNLSSRGLTAVPPAVYRLDVDAPPEARRDVSFAAAAEQRWWERAELTKLLLASNRIARLDDDVRLLPALLTLDLHDNRLSDVPEALGELTQLRQLRLGQNQLRLLPLGLFSASGLQTLSLQKNQLESVPEQLGNLTRLTHLDLSHNLLGALPDSLGGLESLLDLQLAHNRLGRLPPGAARLTRLRSLDCSHNLLDELPADLSALTGLEQLRLRHNRLRLLPELLPPNLKELYLGNNHLEAEGAGPLSGHAHLSVLDLRGNRLARVPDGVAALQTLTRLDLADNDIATLPPAIGLLPRLTALQLEGNPLRGLRRDMLTKGTGELLKYLRGRIQPEEPAEAAERSGLRLPSDDPLHAESIRTLKVLDYSDRKALQVPDELFAAAAAADSVTRVDLSRNQLSCVPDGLALLASSLRDLSLAFNRLTACSPALCGLRQLTHLDLRNNQLSDLPPDMTTLEKLLCINLQFNRFRSVPEVLHQLGSLETLVLGNNQIQEVDPAGLRALERLSTLDLSNNDLTRVPPELGLCSSLRRLVLEGNPFRTPRPAVLAKGTEAVLEFLRGRVVPPAPPPPPQ
ncbi:leucine-rich repeat-containing protein 40 [Salarias fasciatus]|uniref:Leucine-rich repeat-containing protein 40-like n=1 Tax=Salarias fasciatus TaxID=181472 RepID=A0A672FE06_SALFA|nr:leucine-rich repeat-containing protein 40-like [Salarias fasciatus]